MDFKNILTKLNTLSELQVLVEGKKVEGKKVEAEKAEDKPVKEAAVSQTQQKAAGTALAARREGDTSKLKGAAKEMSKMSIKELEKFASTKHKDLPKKKTEPKTKAKAKTNESSAVAASKPATRKTSGSQVALEAMACRAGKKKKAIKESSEFDAVIYDIEDMRPGRQGEINLGVDFDYQDQTIGSRPDYDIEITRAVDLETGEDLTRYYAQLPNSHRIWQELVDAIGDKEEANKYHREIKRSRMSYDDQRSYNESRSCSTNKKKKAIKESVDLEKIDGALDQLKAGEIDYEQFLEKLNNMDYEGEGDFRDAELDAERGAEFDSKVKEAFDEEESSVFPEEFKAAAESFKKGKIGAQELGQLNPTLGRMADELARGEIDYAEFVKAVDQELAVLNAEPGKDEMDRFERGMKNESKDRKSARALKESANALSFKDMVRLVRESGGQQQIDPLDQTLWEWANRVAARDRAEGADRELYAGLVYERMGGRFDLYDVLSESAVTEAARKASNFTMADISKLESMSDLNDVKAAAIELLKTPSKHPMDPEKIAYHTRVINDMTSKGKIMVHMSNLLLAGEGKGVVGDARSQRYYDRFSSKH